MDYETALCLKPSIVGSVCNSLSGALAEAAEKLALEGEVERGLEGDTDYGQPETWFDCNPR